MAKNEYVIGSDKPEAGRATGMGRRMGGGPGGRMGGMGGGMGEKPKAFGKTWAKLIRYMKPWMPAIIVALVCAAGGTVLNVLGPSKIRELTNLIYAPFESLMETGAFTGIDLNAVLNIGLILVAFYSVGAALSMAQGYIMAGVTQRTTRSMRSRLCQKINRLPLKYFDTTSYGNIMSRVANDVDTIGQTLNQSIGSLITSAVMLTGSLVMMFVTNWIMALCAIGSALAGFALMTVIVTVSQKFFRAQASELGALNGHIEEIYAGHNVVKAYNGEKDAEKTFRGINQKLRKSAWVSQFLSGLMQPLMGFVGNLGYVVVCVVGAVLLQNNMLEFGAIAAFIIYVRLFTNPLSQIAQAATSMQSAAAAGERVFAFLEETELSDESDKTAVLSTVKGDVTFEHVVFGYDENRTIIKDFNADVTAGQKIAIVGPTGAGKTTIVNLLMRFYELNGGNIRIDGVPIADLTRGNVHELFSMVLQDTWLFEGTIRENILYNKTDVTDERLREACAAAGIDHFIRTLPGGYDTVLSDNAGISAGQRQLMTIARAMIENAPMLILDEATSSVDTRTELQIQSAMDRLTCGRTSFVIAHRLSTIKNADKILVLKDGDIVEIGRHDELLANGGFYAELYNSQFEQAAL